jgi:hypothetical protein
MAKRKKDTEKANTDGYYFGEDVEWAVIRYIESNSAREKNQIFVEKLKVPFTIMIESIIRKYFKDSVSEEQFFDFFDNAMSHVLEKMVLYSEGKGRAFSYIQKIVKTFILIKLKDERTLLLRDVSFENAIDDIINEERFIEEIDVSSLDYVSELMNDVSANIKKSIDPSVCKKVSDNEVLVGRAIISLMDNWEELFSDNGSNKFNKSAIMLYLKEVTNLPTKDIGKAMRKYKAIYGKTKKRIL